MKRRSPLLAASFLLLVSGTPLLAQTVFGEAEYTITVGEAPPDPCEDGPLGAVCVDGAIYVGNTVDGARMFMAPENQPGIYSLKDLDTVTLGTSTADGLLNTIGMLNDIDTHPAAEACTARGPGWYLPSVNELLTLASNGFWRSQFGTVWTSGQSGVQNGMIFNGVSYGSLTRTVQQKVLCVRVGAATVSGSMAGLTIPPIASALPDTLVSSEPVYPLLRSTTPVPVSVSGEGSPEVSINGRAFSPSGSIRSGETLVVRVRSSNGVGETRTVQINMGGQPFPFSVTTRSDCRSGPIGSLCADGTIYAYNDANGERVYLATRDEPGSYAWQLANTGSIPSARSGVSGYRATLSLLSSDKKDVLPAVNVCARRGPGWFLPSLDDVFRLRMNGSALSVPAALNTTTGYWTSYPDEGSAQWMNLLSGFPSSGTASVQRRVRCARLDLLDVPQLASPFPIGSIPLAEPDSLVTSAPVLVYGLRSATPAPISVSGDGSPQISVAGGAFKTSSTILDGQDFVVRVRSAQGFNETRTVTVTVGGRSETFSVTTAGDCEAGPVGTQCADGAVYAGNTGEGSVRFYIAPTSFPETWWKTTQTSSPGASSTTDGMTNTISMMAEPTAHPAASTCAGIGPGWFLPSEEEMKTAGANLAFLPVANLVNGTYMTSTEVGATSFRAVNPVTGVVSTFAKTTFNSLFLRCARLGDEGEPGVAAVSFFNFGSVSPDLIVSSSPAPIIGLKTRAPVEASVSGEGSPQISVNGGDFTSSAQVRIGDLISVRLRAAPDLGVTRVATITIGASTSTFSVTTGSCEAETAPVGSICADGAIFAGVNAEGSRFYLAPQDEPSTLQWKGSRTDTAGADSASDGFLNTVMMIRSSDYHPAAAACRARGDEWYLPSFSEMGTIYQNRSGLGHAGLQNASYWSSTETAAGAASAHSPRLSASWVAVFKDASRWVRCVRTGLDQTPVAPAPFTIPSASGSPGAQVTSEVIIPTGLRSLAPIDVFISGGGDPEFSIEGGPYVVAGQLVVGQSVRVRANAPTSDWGSHTVTLTFDAGPSARSGTFTVTSTGSCEDPSASIGTVCADGAVYAGLNSAQKRFYVAGQVEPSALQWQIEMTYLDVESSRGRINTDAMIEEGIANFPAAQACVNRGAAWYLPSRDELSRLSTVRGLGVGPFPVSGTTAFWSSEENSRAYALARRLDGTNTATSSTMKTTPLNVLCVRY